MQPLSFRLEEVTLRNGTVNFTQPTVQKKKFFIMISDIRKDKMTIVAELEDEGSGSSGKMWIIFSEDTAMKRNGAACMYGQEELSKIEITAMMSFTKKWSGQNGITGRSAISGQ